MLSLLHTMVSVRNKRIRTEIKKQQICDLQAKSCGITIRRHSDELNTLFNGDTESH